MQFFEELRRRNVIRVGIAYLVAAWLVVQVVETLFPVYGLSDGAIRLVVTVLAIGLVPTLVFAWIYERTSEGIKRQKDVDRSQSITPETGRRLDRAIIVVLVLAVGYFAWDKFIARTEPPPAAAESASPALEGWKNRRVAADRKSIAVLPFTNMSGDAANEPFTLGVHDDLLTHLSHIDALKTTSRTSVLQYRGTTKTIPEIGAELGVEYILEGGIQRAGDRVRINMQLIDAATDEHLWAEIYDRRLTPESLFAVQAEIATEVSRSLKATLLPAERDALDDAPTQSMAAYDLYLLGRHHQVSRTRESLERAADYYARAIEEDPDYVLAYAGLAQSKLLLAGYRFAPGEEVVPEAEALIERAMALDDSVSAVWAARGLAFAEGGNAPAAIEALERAIELDQQNYQAWLWYSRALHSVRRFPEQLEALEVAYALEPMSLPVNNNLGIARRWRGDFAGARRHFQRADQVDDSGLSEWKEQIARTYLDEGDLDQAVITAREILAQDPANLDLIVLLVGIYAELGDLAEARRWVDEGEKLGMFSVPAIRWYEAREDFDGLIAYLEDKQALVAARTRTGVRGDALLLPERFMAAYLGRRTETASAYLDAHLASLGGRMEISPYDVTLDEVLAVADFLIRHGEGLPGGSERGRAMVAEASRSLRALNEAGFEHPGLWFHLAIARALSGEHEPALRALETAVERGYSSRLRLEHHPALDTLRADPAFAALLERVDARLAEERRQVAVAELAAFEPAGERQRVALPRARLEKYAGHYTDGNLLGHFFIDASGEFMLEMGSMAPLPLVPVAENVFYPRLAEGLSLEFVTDEDGVVTQMELSGAGDVQRFTPTDPPPPTVELEPAALAAFTGTWAAERVRGASGGTADTDIWTAVISVDGEGQAWIDFDDQPPLTIAAAGESAFIIPGFVGTFEFEDLDGDGVFDQIVFLGFGRELVFERQ